MLGPGAIRYTHPILYMAVCTSIPPPHSVHILLHSSDPVRNRHIDSATQTCMETSFSRLYLSQAHSRRIRFPLTSIEEISHAIIEHYSTYIHNLQSEFRSCNSSGFEKETSALAGTRVESPANDHMARYRSIIRPSSHLWLTRIFASSSSYTDPPSHCGMLINRLPSSGCLLLSREDLEGLK